MKIRMMLGAAFAALTLVGCGADNVAACQSWIDKTSCGSYDFSSIVDCDMYKNTTCDISDYFDCLTEKTTCDGDQADTSGWSSCASKAVCE